MGRPHPKASSFARTRASTHQTQAYLNPHKVPIKPNANPRPVQKPAFLTDDVRQTQQLANQVGASSQDLQLQIRSEIGNDGDDTYLETYAENIYTAIVNIFAYKRFDNYFLLGSANNAGLLGSTQVGSITGSSSRIDEIQSIQDFSENFTTTTYKDSGSTTAAGWGTGSLVFTTGGSVGVFTSWKSGSYNLTTFDRIRIDILFGSYGGSLTTFEASFNGGSNYTTIYPTLESTLANTGSDFRLRITDQHGSLILTKVDIITKGTNFT